MYIRMTALCDDARFIHHFFLALIGVGTSCCEIDAMKLLLGV